MEKEKEKKKGLYLILERNAFALDFTQGQIIFCYKR